MPLHYRRSSASCWDIPVALIGVEALPQSTAEIKYSVFRLERVFNVQMPPVSRGYLKLVFFPLKILNHFLVFKPLQGLKRYGSGGPSM